MTIFLSVVFKVIATVMAAVNLLTYTPFAKETFAPLHEEELLLNCSVLSDVHMESYEFHRFTTFRMGLRDIAGAKAESDALVLVGDNTMNAQWFEYLMLYTHLNAFNSSKNTLLAMGNHDVNEGENSIETAIGRHNDFYNAYTGSKNDKAYYSRVINGYHFIVLGSEGAAGTNAYISPAQLEWFEQEMVLAAQSGKPILVFLHQPVNDFEGNDWGTGGGIGEQSQAVWDIVSSQPEVPVLMFSGHLHNSIDYVPPVQRGNVTLVNLPTFTGDENNSGTLRGKGYGYQVEAYADSIVLRARNFRDGVWVESIAVSIPLV